MGWTKEEFRFNSLQEKEASLFSKVPVFYVAQQVPLVLYLEVRLSVLWNLYPLPPNVWAKKDSSYGLIYTPN